MIEYDIAFRSNAIKNSIFGIIDLLCLFIGFIAFLCAPFHRIPCYGRCLGQLFDNLKNTTHKTKYPQLQVHHIWICVAFVNILIGITDFFITLPIFIISLITHPVGTIKSFKKFNIDWDPKQQQNQNENNQNQQARNNGTSYDQYLKLIRYNWPLRTQFFSLALFGLLGMKNPCYFPNFDSL